MRLSGLSACFKLLDARQRRDYGIVTMLATFAALMEMVGMAAIIPVITVLVGYQGATSNEHMQWVLRILGEPDRQTFLIILALVAIATVWFSGFVGFLSVYANQRYLRRVNADLAVRVYQKYMGYPIESFYARPSSEFIRNVNGISEAVTTGIFGASVNVIARAIQIIVVAAILFAVNFQVTAIILLVIGGAYTSIFLSVRHRVAEMSTRNLAESRVLQQLIIGSYQAYRSIVIDQQLDSFIEHFRKLKRATSRTMADIQIIGSAPRQLIEVIGITLLIVASYIIGSSSENSRQFVAIMALFGIAAYRVLPSAQQLYNTLNQMVASLAVYRVVADEWGDLRTSPPLHAASEHLVERPMTLEAKGVTYAIDDKALFNDLSVSLELSGVIRIAGDSGVGKSTFIELLAGLRQPRQGALLLNGAPLIGQQRLRWWSQIAYVSQTDYVYEGTLRDNVVLDRPFDESKLERTAEICGLAALSRHGTFDADQDISEAGTNLSGGQRGRILLARALYKPFDVLFLDEAFAALDVNSAKAILSGIRAEFPNKCLIVVSHREAELPRPFHTVSLDTGK